MGKYLVMIYDDEAKWDAAEESVMEQNHKNHQAFAEANGAALRGGGQLDGSTTATAGSWSPTGRSRRPRR